MRLCTGQTYLDRNGNRVRIVMKTGYADKDHEFHRPFLGSNGVRYAENGRVNYFEIQGQDMQDLVSALPEQIVDHEPTIAQAFGTLAKLIVNRIASRL